MKIRELQKALGKLDPELDVLCYCEDTHGLVEGRGFIVFEILAVNRVEAESTRLKDGTPYLKFDKGPASGPIAIVEITSDF